VKSHRTEFLVEWAQERHKNKDGKIHENIVKQQHENIVKQKHKNIVNRLLRGRYGNTGGKIGGIA
jgi:hypothetical protein